MPDPSLPASSSTSLTHPGASLPPAQWPRPSAPAPTEGLQWERYISALLRYKWLILLISILGAAAAVVASRLIRPQYDVQATIWISSETPQGRSAGPLRAEELVNAHAWPDLVRSFTILDQVVRDVSLYLSTADAADAPLFAGFVLADKFRPGEYELRVDGSGREYALLDAAGRRVEVGSVTDSIGRSAGFRWQPGSDALFAGRTVRFGIATPREAAVKLRDELSISLPRESNLLRIGLTDGDPTRAAATMNALVTEVVRTASHLKKRNHMEFARTLKEQLDHAEGELRDAEIALESFRVSTITLPSEGGPVAGGIEATRDPVLTSFFNQKIERDEIGYELGVLRRTLDEIRRGELDVMALWPIPVVQTNAPELKTALSDYASKAAALRAARQVYTDEHTKVRELRSSLTALEERAIPQLAATFIGDLSRRASDLDARIGTASAELRAIPTRTIEEMRLRRNVEVREHLYETLKGRYEEAKLAEASAIPDISVLDSAVAPQTPNSNSAPRIVIIGILASIGFALALAILLDQFDRRFRYPSQVTGGLGLEIIGAIPAIRTKGRKHSPDDAAQIVECLRTIRLNLRHATMSSGPLVLTVSSPGVGDGKSLVCANLALSFAESGVRTLLIDGDVRRGELHRTFGTERSPGLIDLLAGEVSLGEVLHATEHAGLEFMPSGSRRRSGPELLASPAMSKLIARMRAQFDVIIVDSAPLGAGIDPFALAVATTNLVLVFRTGTTDRGMAEAKLHHVDRLPVRVLGAILNDVNARGVFRYYSYLYGYTASEEEPRFGSPALSGEVTAAR